MLLAKKINHFRRQFFIFSRADSQKISHFEIIFFWSFEGVLSVFGLLADFQSNQKRSAPYGQRRQKSLMCVVGRQ